MTSFMVERYTLDSITPAIHRSEWRGNSPKFAYTEFSEVRAGLSGRGAVYRRRTTLFCTERHGIFGAHSALVPALRRRVFIFPSRDSASATPSTRFAGSSPLSNPIVQATPLRAACFRQMVRHERPYLSPAPIGAAPRERGRGHELRIVGEEAHHGVGLPAPPGVFEGERR